MSQSKTNKIIEFFEAYPESSQAVVARACGCSIPLVSRTLKKAGFTSAAPPVRGLGEENSKYLMRMARALGVTFYEALDIAVSDAVYEYEKEAQKMSKAG